MKGSAAYRRTSYVLRGIFVGSLGWYILSPMTMHNNARCKGLDTWSQTPQRQLPVRPMTLSSFLMRWFSANLTASWRLQIARQLAMHSTHIIMLKILIHSFSRLPIKKKLNILKVCFFPLKLCLLVDGQNSSCSFQHLFPDWRLSQIYTQHRKRNHVCYALSTKMNNFQKIVRLFHCVIYWYCGASWCFMVFLPLLINIMFNQASAGHGGKGMSRRCPRAAPQGLVKLEISFLIKEMDHLLAF